MWLLTQRTLQWQLLYQKWGKFQFALHVPTVHVPFIVFFFSFFCFLFLFFHPFLIHPFHCILSCSLISFLCHIIVFFSVLSFFSFLDLHFSTIPFLQLLWNNIYTIIHKCATLSPGCVSVGYGLGRDRRPCAGTVSLLLLYHRLCPYPLYIVV